MLLPSGPHSPRLQLQVPVGHDLGGWRRAPCHCSNRPGAGRVSYLSDITHLRNHRARPVRLLPGRGPSNPSTGRAVSGHGSALGSPPRYPEKRVESEASGGEDGEKGGAAKGGGYPGTALRVRGSRRAFYHVSDGRAPCPHVGQEEGPSTVLPRRTVSARTAATHRTRLGSCTCDKQPARSPSRASRV